MAVREEHEPTTFSDLMAGRVEEDRFGRGK
jgi:hypothetical protein